MVARIMINAKGGNLQAVKEHFGHVDMLGWYGTGAIDVPATPSELALFSGAILVEIDQAGGHSPVPGATVRDVETGAWSVDTAVSNRPWNADRPTIYCSRDTLPTLADAGWKGDVWLAWPGYNSNEAPVVNGMNVVAVQNDFAQLWESSLVYDPTWPGPKVPAPPQPKLTVLITDRQGSLTFPAVNNAGHYVIEYTAASGGAPVLVARNSVSTTADTIAMHGVAIPGSQGGILAVYAIVDGNAVPNGMTHLP